MGIYKSKLGVSGFEIDLIVKKIDRENYDMVHVREALAIITIQGSTVYGKVLVGIEILDMHDVTGCNIADELGNGVHVIYINGDNVLNCIILVYYDNSCKDGSSYIKSRVWSVNVACIIDSCKQTNVRILSCACLQASSQNLVYKRF